MKPIYILIFSCFISIPSFSQTYDCPETAIGGLPADSIYSVLSSFSSNSYVSAQSFVNLDSLDFEAVSVIGLRQDGNWEFCTDQTPPKFNVDFWTYENLLPGQLIESIEDAYLTIDSLDTWNFNDKDWILERFTFTFEEPRNHPLGFISIYNLDESPNNTCQFYWLYNHPDNINLEGATIHDDGTTVIWNAFNFCLLSEGIAMTTQNLKKEIEVEFFPNPFQNFLSFENKNDFEKIELFDAVGNLRFSKRLNNNFGVENIKVEELPSGVYFSRLTGKGKVVTASNVLIKK